MSAAPCRLNCWENHEVPGPELVPGDVVSLGRPSPQVLGPPGTATTSPTPPSPEEEPTVPADMLLLAGTLISNEALLTGESTPQWKVCATTVVYKRVQ